MQPALVSGVIPKEEKNVSELYEKMVQGRLDDLVSGRFGIILGEDLANRLGVSVGDKVTLVTPQVSLSPAGVIPRFKRFTVAGIFRSGGGFGFDMGLAYINLTDAQKLFALGSSVSGMHVAINNVYAAPRITEQLIDQLTPTARVNNWTEQFGAFFHAVKLEKTMMFFYFVADYCGCGV